MKIDVNKDLWEQFLNREVVVNCKTKDEAIRLLKYCIENDLGWTDSSPEEENLWESKDTCYECDEDQELGCADVDYYNSHKINIITYEEFFKE